MRLLVIAALVVTCVSPLWAAEKKYEAPTYPEPQTWEKAQGALDVKGCSVFVPEGSSAKVRAIANALRKRLSIICATDVPLKERSVALGKSLMLCIARSAPDWKALAGTLDLAAIPEAEASQGYVLQITPKHAVMASSFALGLSYGAVTMMDIARRAGGTSFSSVKITDWPDMPIRGFYGTHVFNNSTLDLKAMKKAAALAPIVKQGMLVLDIDTGAFDLDGHPELHRTGGWDKDTYAEMVRLPMAEGIEVVPWLQMGKCISLRFGVPYAPLDDFDPTYLWGFETVSDEMLEVFLPKNLCVGMNEDWHILFGPHKRRDKEKWRDIAARFAEYLRRRGVSTWIIADYLHGPNGMGYGGAWAKEIKSHGLRNKHRPIEFYVPLLAHQNVKDDKVTFQHGSVLKNRRTKYPSKPNKKMSDKEFDKRFKAMMDDYRAYAESFPTDMVFFPKKSSPPHTVAFGNMADAGLRTVAFSPYVAVPGKKHYPRIGNGQPWSAAIRYLRRDEGKATAQGCISAEFAGGWYSIHGGVQKAQYLRGAAPQWKVDSVKDVLSECMKHFVTPSKEETAVSLDWRSLMDADPKGTLPQAIQRIKDATWRWVGAREDVVARGFLAVPALLGAMKSSDGELRQRFEGCVSRIARDARNGIDRGTLDVTSVERYLLEPKSDLANIAAEAIGAAGPKGVTRLIDGLSRPKETAGCAWAIRYTPSAGVGAKLCAVLTANGFPPEARANAARSAGLLLVKEAIEPLAALIKTEKDTTVQREAAWALALLGARDHDKEVATLLQSSDKATRCRAVMALVVLRSPELLGVGHMLASEDRNEAWIATWALFPGHVFDRHISQDRKFEDRPGKLAYDRAKRFYRVKLDIFDIEKAVPRAAALKLIAKAASTQKDEILKALMERIPTEQDGFEYQGRPFSAKKKR